MALVARTFNWLPNPDGTVDGHNPAGDKNPHIAALAWGDLSAFIAAIQQTATGSSLSDNARTALIGTNAATATITWETVSGSDVTATGFTVGGDNVLISSATAGNGFGRLGANDGTGIVYSAPIQWTRTAAPTDVLAPTTPTGLTGTPVNGGITWTWDPASDPHDGTHAGAGVKEYDLELNGVITVVAGLPGVVSAPTVSNIGTISNPATPTAVQAGRNWTLTAAGTGADGTSDQILFLNWPVSGDCRAVCKINSVGGAGSTFGVAGLMMRESLAVGSKYVALDQFRSAQSQAIQGKQRLTTGGARSNLSTGTGTNTPRWVMIERIGNVFTLSYSLDGMVWVALDNTTIPMASSIFIGGFATSLSAGNEVIGVLNDLNVSSAPRASYTQTTSAATMARVRARDLQTPTPNVGGYCALSSAVTPLVSIAPPKKWNPGDYVFESNKNTYNATRLAEILAIANCAGYKIRVNWSAIETSRGVYSWTLIDNILSVVRAAGKQLIVDVSCQSFGSGDPNPVPAYLATEPNAGGGWYTKTSPYQGKQAKVYLSAVMARIIALVQAFAAKYDTDPNVEGFIFMEESSMEQKTSQSDYTESGLLARQLDYIAAAGAALPRTNVWLGANFGYQSPKNNWRTIFDALVTAKIGYTGPDAYTSGNGDTDADKTARGLTYNGSAWVAGGKDFRGLIPIHHDFQGPELGGKENSGGGQTLATLYTQSHTVLKDNHTAWLYKDFEYATFAPADVYWDNTKSYAHAPLAGSQDIKTLISGGASPTVTAKPSVYDAIVIGANTPVASLIPLTIVNIKPAGTGSPALASTNRIFRAYPGLDYNFRASIVGGGYPYICQLSGQPSGMTVDNDGVIDWPNPTGTPGAVTLTVTDSVGAQVSATWTPVVSTSGFYFIDASYGGTETGSITQPYSSMANALTGATGHPTDIFYFKNGTYNMQTWNDSSPRMTITNVPWTWLAYPGHAPVIDGANTYHMRAWNGFYFDGITVQNVLDYGWTFSADSTVGNYCTVRRSTLKHITSSTSLNNNQGFMSSATGTGQGYGLFVSECDFSDWTGAQAVGSIYASNFAAIVDSTFHDGAFAGPHSFVTPIGFKHWNTNNTVRGNRILLPNGSVDNCFEFYSAADGDSVGDTFDVSYNTILHANPAGQYIKVYYPTNFHFFRNTSNIDFYFLPLLSPGPDTLSKNLFVDLAITNPDNVVDNDNLKTTLAQGAIDSNGDLTSSYLSYLGKYGAQIP